MLSLVVPVFNEEASLPQLHEALGETARQISKMGIATQVVFVDNRSVDATWSLVEQLAESENDFWTLGVRHPHNLGMQQSLLTGIRVAEGDCIAVLQADLQDPPELLITMVKKWTEGDRYVATQMSKRHEQLIHRIGAWCFYKGLRVVSGQKIRTNSTDFYLFDRTLVPELIFRSGTTPFLRSTLASIRMPDSVLDYQRRERKAGKKASVRRRADFAFEAFLVNLGGLSRRLVAIAMMLCAIVGLATAGLIAAFVLGYRSPVAGWMTSTLLLFAVVAGGLLLGSLQITFLYRLNRDMPRRDWLSESEIVRSLATPDESGRGKLP